MARKVIKKRTMLIGTDPAFLTPKQRAKVFDEGTYTATETGARKAALMKQAKKGY